jgi:hypothetical protein
MAEQRLEYIISAIDRSRAGTQSLVRNLEQAKKANTELTQSAVRGSVQTQNALKGIVTHAHTTGRAVAAMAKQAAAGFESVTKHAKSAHAAMMSVANVASGPLRGGMLAAAGGTAAMTGLLAVIGKTGIEANKFKEAQIASLTAMLKSRQEAEKLYGWLSKFADVTPFDDQEVVAAGKALQTFGFDARKYLGLVGDTAAAMKIPLEQVVHTLAKLRAGSFDMSEMSPVGVTREGLQKHGIKFSASGEPEDRTKLLGAGTALLQSQFGGLMSGAAGGFDARASTMESNLRRVAQKSTEGLFGSMGRGASSVSGVLEGMLGGGAGSGIMKSLSTVFDAIGRSIENATKGLGGFVVWLEKVASSDNLKSFFSTITGYVIAFGKAIGRVFGIDLEKATDPANIDKFFGALRLGVDKGISALFGMGRVFQEVVKIIESGIIDSKNHFSDLADDVSRGFRRMFLSLQSTIHSFGADMLRSILAVMDGLNSVKNPLTGKPIFAMDTSAVSQALGGQVYASGIMSNRINQLDAETVQVGDARRQRDAARDKADPFRKDDVMKRISDAFQGVNRDRSAEGAFFSDVGKGQAWAREFFFGSDQPGRGPAGAGIPGAPNMFGGRRGATVTQSRQLTFEERMAQMQAGSVAGAAQGWQGMSNPEQMQAWNITGAGLGWQGEPNLSFDGNTMSGRGRYNFPTASYPGMGGAPTINNYNIPVYAGASKDEILAALEAQLDRAGIR